VSARRRNGRAWAALQAALTLQLSKNRSSASSQAAEARGEVVPGGGTTDDRDGAEVLTG
jgi:hypothetical protein